MELILRNQTNNSDVYHQQLMKPKEAIKDKCSEMENCKGIVIHHDNTMPMSSMSTREKLSELGWEWI